MLTSIDVKFVFESARLGLFSSTNILLLANVAFWVVFLLFLPCSCHVFRLVLNFGMSEMSAIFVFTTKTTQPCPQVFAVNGALTCRKLHFWRHWFINHKILPNFVICSWLWWIMHMLLANQSREIFWKSNSYYYYHYYCYHKFILLSWLQSVTKRLQGPLISVWNFVT